MPNSSETGPAVGPVVKLLVMIGSSASIGFGVWHFFVPAVWNWYSHIDPKAAELVIAIRAINFLFSLGLVMLGAVTMAFVHGGHANKYSLVVVLVASTALWAARVALQIVWPQGSMSPMLQYGMLSAFIAITLCYGLSLYVTASKARGRS